MIPDNSLFFPDGVDRLDLHRPPSGNQSRQQTAQQQYDRSRHGGLYIHARMLQGHVATRRLGGKDAVGQVEQEDTRAQAK